jgi:hypothetical protein
VKRENGQQATLPEQRDELIRGDSEADKVHRREHPLEQETRVPVAHSRS